MNVSYLKENGASESGSSQELKLRKSDPEEETEGLDDPEGYPGFNAPAGTVFADPSNFSIKHPLQNKWSLWYDNPRKKTQDTWGSHLKKVVDFDTVR